MKLHVKQADALLVSLENAYKAAPKLPKEFTDFVVAVTPWLAVISGVLLLISMVLFTLVSVLVTIFALLGGAPLTAVAMLVTLGAWIISGILLVMAFKPLQKRELVGWKMLAYVELLVLLVFFVNLIFRGALYNAVLGVIACAVGFYFLFQTKHYYK